MPITKENGTDHDLLQTISAISLGFSRLTKDIDIYTFSYTSEGVLSIGISAVSLMKLPGELIIRGKPGAYNSSPIFIKIVAGVEFFSTRLPEGTDYRLIPIEEPAEQPEAA